MDLGWKRILSNLSRQYCYYASHSAYSSLKKFRSEFQIVIPAKADPEYFFAEKHADPD